MFQKIAASFVLALALVSRPAMALSGTASTTRYYDGQMGACGCGTSSSAPFSWQLEVAEGVYTAAGSPALFDNADSTWCGSGCGQCYKLTSSGHSACSTCGSGGETGNSIIVMVTNLCPYSGNEAWCPNTGSSNIYGYEYHFDLMAQSEIFGDNPVVSFESVDCPTTASSAYSQCQCA